MSWTLAGNLVSLRSRVKAVFPKLTVYDIGDQKHQAENSDHNPDAAGVVHAIDIMCAAGSAAAKLLLPYILANHASLQYVIHNGRIWGVNNGGWTGAGQRYHGSDQHTDHIHVSGKHGSAHRNAATGTGYDLVAEKMTFPAIEGEDMPLTPTDAKLVADTLLGRMLGSSGPTVGVALQSGYHNTVAILAGQNPDKLAAALKAEGLDVDVDPADLQTALINALKTLADADDDTPAT